jgi:hypothetical protein
MMKGTWGLLGPEFLLITRRTRTLGLSASIRLFNDLAVPGLGNVWYGKQLLLATLGVTVAKMARRDGAKVQNIEVANAIEALACWLAFKNNGWNPDARLRGRTKLQDKNDFSFRRARQRNFYVTQPMRMATVQALPALGFVESDSVRFNAFCCTDEGEVFIKKATEDYRPYKRSVTHHLTCWVKMEEVGFDSDALRRALSPLEPLSEGSRRLLRERLIQGGTESHEDKKRRGNALAWVERLQRDGSKKSICEARPPEISELHWCDLQAGSLFFQARDAAIKTLDSLEAHVGNQTSGQSFSLGKGLPVELERVINKLRFAANEYLKLKYDDNETNKFCNECTNSNSSEILFSLVKRDGQVLRLFGNDVKPGPAFRGSAKQINSEDDDNEDTLASVGIPLPSAISYRMRNLYLLNLDLQGKLGDWLNATTNGSES